MNWLQRHWDARAAANFMLGGAGSGLSTRSGCTRLRLCVTIHFTVAAARWSIDPSPRSDFSPGASASAQTSCTLQPRAASSMRSVLRLPWLSRSSAANGPIRPK